MEYQKGILGNVAGLALGEAGLDKGLGHGVPAQPGQIIEIVRLLADQPVTYRADALGGQSRGRLRMMLGDPGTAGAFRLTNHLIHRPEGIVQVEGDQFQSSHRESESSGLIGAAGYPLSPINPP